jgi:hypothetical protein
LDINITTGTDVPVHTATPSSSAESVVKSYKDVASAGLQHNNADGAYTVQSVSRTTNVTAEDGFTTFIRKKGRTAEEFSSCLQFLPRATRLP